MTPRYLRSILLASALMLISQTSGLCDYTEDIPSTLQRYEVALLGQSMQGKPIMDRLRNLEKLLWKKPQTGSLPERLDRIGQMLSGKASGAGTAPQGTVPQDTAAAADPGTLPGPSPEPPVPPAPSAPPDQYATGEPPGMYGFKPPTGKPQKAPATPATQQQVDAALDKAMELYKAGKILDAKQAFHKVLELDPKNVDASYNLGVIAETQKDYATARAFYKKALQHSPGDRSLIDAIAQMDKYLGDSDR